MPALNTWADLPEYMTARLMTNRLPGKGCMHDNTTERSINSQTTWVIDVLGLLSLALIIFGMLSMDVCTTLLCQMSGRLVQELSTCTVWNYNWT